MANPVEAQGEVPSVEWEVISGGAENELSDDASQLRDGRFALAARTTADGRFQFCWILIDGAGKVVRTRSSGGAEGLARAVEATDDGGFVVAGGRAGRVHLLKADAQGEIEWERAHATGMGFSVAPALEGGFVVAGMSEGDVYLLRTDAEGRTEWERRHGGERSDLGTWVREVPGPVNAGGGRSSLGFVVAGITSSIGPTPGNNAYLLRTGPSGAFEWETFLGTSGEDWAEGVAVTPEGRFAFSGSSAGEFFLAVVDVDGRQLWQSLLGGLESNGVEQLPDGGFVLGGLRHSPTEGDNEPRVVRTDAAGRHLWSQVLGRPGHTGWFSSIEPTSDGGFILAGSIRDRADPYFDVYVVKLGPERAARTPFLRGDANGDGLLNVSDPIAHLERLFAAGEPAPCGDAADANDDGRLDLSDALYTLGFLFLGRPAPPEPFPDPGLEPTPDALGCDGG